MYLWACQAVAVGPVSASPSPMTATQMRSGLSMMALFVHDVSPNRISQVSRDLPIGDGLIE